MYGKQCPQAAANSLSRRDRMTAFVQQSMHSMKWSLPSAHEVPCIRNRHRQTDTHRYRQTQTYTLVHAGLPAISLDVHHGVGVLAGVGLAATAGAGSNGHPMLPAGHVTPHRNVQRGVGIKEAEGLEEEADMLGWHDRPVLNTGNVRHPKGMPDHTISLHQVPVLQHTMALSAIGQKKEGGKKGKQPVYLGKHIEEPP